MEDKQSNEGGMLYCLTPTITGLSSLVAAGWTICVPQFLAYGLWAIAGGLFLYTCHTFISIKSQDAS